MCDRKHEMTHKTFQMCLFLTPSLAVGIGQMLWFGAEFPFMGALMGPPDTNAFAAWSIPALLAGLFGFFRPKPKEIWSYGLLMWMPRAIRFGTEWVMHPTGWVRGFGLIVVASSLLAAVVCVLGSYAGFGLRKIATRIWVSPEEPPSIAGMNLPQS